MWEGVGDWTELQHIDPHSIGHNRVSFPFFWAAQPGTWGPSFSGCWFSLLHLISNSLNFLCTELYNSSTPTFFLWVSQIALIQPIPIYNSWSHCWLQLAKWLMTDSWPLVKLVGVSDCYLRLRWRGTCWSDLLKCLASKFLTNLNIWLWKLVEIEHLSVSRFNNVERLNSLIKKTPFKIVLSRIFKCSISSK